MTVSHRLQVRGIRTISGTKRWSPVEKAIQDSGAFSNPAMKRFLISASALSKASRLLVFPPGSSSRFWGFRRVALQEENLDVGLPRQIFRHVLPPSSVGAAKTLVAVRSRNAAAQSSDPRIIAAFFIIPTGEISEHVGVLIIVDLHQPAFNSPCRRF